MRILGTRWLTLCGVLLALNGCAGEGAIPKGDESAAPTEGKFDSFRRPTEHGLLALGETVEAVLSADEQFHAWDFEVDRQGKFTVRTGKRTPQSRNVDTVLYLYKQSASGWGRYIDRQDDDGDSLFSTISRTLDVGRYRALVKGYSPSDTGRFNITLSCDDCAPTPVCAFGEGFYETRTSHTVITVVDRDLTSPAGLTQLEQSQILDALDSSSHDDVTTIEGAFEAVDQGEINYIELWDRSTNRAFTAVEYGAGDNSFGAIYAYGTTTRVATINDGDLYDCTVDRGPFGKECSGDASCDASERCVGGESDGALGRCMDLSNEDPAVGQTCTASSPCPGGKGLVCAGITRGDEGLCDSSLLSAWFEPREPQELDVPPGDEGLVFHFPVSGLATVDTDVRLTFIAYDFDRGIKVTLTNPAGTEALVFQGVPDRNELYLRNATVLGHPGDESVNGEWTLRVTDNGTGTGGRTYEVRLDLMSRWD